jgi:hypothetical protein
MLCNFYLAKSLALDAGQSRVPPLSDSFCLCCLMPPLPHVALLILYFI